jgi:hypothetical protein
MPGGDADALRQQLAFEELLSALSSAFVAVAPGEVDAEIARWLRRLVEFLGVDRSGVAQMSPDRRVLQTTHAYAVEGAPPDPRFALDTFQVPSRAALHRRRTSRPACRP